MRDRAETRPRATWRFFPSREGTAAVGNAFLFVRDLPLGIMPLRHGREQTEFSVRLEPHDPAVEAWFPGFVDIGRFTPRGVEDGLCSFVETASSQLAYFGEAYFELEEAVEPTVTPYGRLGLLAPGRLVRLPGRYLQLIPRGDRERTNGKHWNSVPASRLWHVKLPAAISSPRAHRRMLRRLARLGGGVTPSFVFDTSDLGNSVGYDLTAHIRACRVATERATNAWGTIPSFNQVDGTTEYFLFSRRLQWQRTQALLRDHLIGELNRLLSKLGTQSRLVVTGLPTVTDFDDALTGLSRCEMRVDEVMALGRL